MFRDEKLELKVGMFIGIAIFVMFLIVFSIKDITLIGETYDVSVIFNFINGVKESSPVRLAGVNVGEVKKVELYYDESEKKTKVKLGIIIRKGVKVEDDAVFRINTLGLLGERYVEITPGMSDKFISAGDVLIGRDPVNVGKQMEKMNELFVRMAMIVKHVQQGKGTLGKLIVDDAMYNNITGVFQGLAEGKGTMGKLITDETLYDNLEKVTSRLKDGEGTIGKLLVEEKIYNDVEQAVEDIKKNPWKLIHKTRERTIDR